ncbi:MAG: L-threonylcarbamoyladenylate synthase [Spirochaetia bacterium]
MLNTALFLDRDGTLIEDVGYLSNIEDIHFIPGIFDILRRLQTSYILFIVSNQVGIAKGLLSHNQVDEINRHIDSVFQQQGIRIQQWFVCPHDRGEGCSCMKPEPGFLLQAANEYELDLSRSFVIGDHPHDPATAEAVGAFGLYVLSGHGMKHLEELPQEQLVFHDLPAAGDWLLEHPNPKTDLEAEVARGAAALQAGELTVFPTETVYGLGADALNPDAVAMIFEAKQRPLHDPLIVHVASIQQVTALAAHLSEKAVHLMETFWPGPFTLVLPKNSQVPDIVTAGNPTVAVRMPANPLALHLIRTAGVPVAAPSANLFGRTSPTSAQHVKNQLSGSYAALIDGGTCRVGVESTVLSLTGETPVILREGGLAREDIEEAIGTVLSRGDGEEDKYDGPGMLPDHYAPTTPLRLVDDIEQYMSSSRVGKLCFQSCPQTADKTVRILSPQGDVREAAINLYHRMQELDAMELDLIVAQGAPNHGLGRAVNDRLKKAAQKA